MPTPAEHADEQLIELVLDGIGDEMPAFAERLADQDIADLLAWLRGAFGPCADDGHDHEH